MPGFSPAFFMRCEFIIQILGNGGQTTFPQKIKRGLFPTFQDISILQIQLTLALGMAGSLLSLRLPLFESFQ